MTRPTLKEIEQAFLLICETAADYAALKAKHCGCTECLADGKRRTEAALLILLHTEIVAPHSAPGVH